VPGIDFTNDPLLQARLFSYLDTQLIRLGGPNFTQIPVNRPVADVRNHQRDGYHQMAVHQGQAAYHPNSLGGGCPVLAGEGGAFTHYQEYVDGGKIRRRSPSFGDHYSQATLFWNSMAYWEKEHIVAAFRFELGKVAHRHIREGVVEHLNHVDHELAVQVAEGVGVDPPAAAPVTNHGRSSPALSQANQPTDTINGRKIAILAAEGVDGDDVHTVQEALVAEGAVCEVIGPCEGRVDVAGNGAVEVAHALPTVGSVLYDAVVLPGGKESLGHLIADGDAVHFVADAFKHGKAIGALGEGIELLNAARIHGIRLANTEENKVADRGVVTQTMADGVSDDFLDALIQAVSAHRHWSRPFAGIAA